MGATAEGGYEVGINVGVWLWGQPGGLWVIWREATTFPGPSPCPLEWQVLEVFLRGKLKRPWAFIAWAGPLLSKHISYGTVKASLGVAHSCRDLQRYWRTSGD